MPPEAPTQRPPESTPERRRAAAEALKRSEATFFHLVGGVEDYAIFLLDTRGTIRSWNAGAQRIKGYAAEEIIGRNFKTFYTQEDLDRRFPEYELEVAARDGRFETEGWRLRKDGTRFWASVVLTAERAEDGALEGFVKITRDLTERKLAEESLRQSEERLRLLIENVRDYAIFALDPEGHIASWNVGAERIKGYTAKEVIGQKFSIFYPPEALAQGKPDWLMRAAMQHGSVEDEGWRVRKNGERFWASVVLTALYDAKGTLRGFAKITRDLTERRQITDLEEADRLKNEFLALLAHELRNPLAPIRSAVHVLGNRRADEAEIARASEIAEHQIQHMSRLLDDLLDIARISQGKLELRRQVIALSEIIRRAADAEEAFIRERKLTLTIEPSMEGLAVDGDPTRLQQVVTNLLNNAAKYTDPGGRIWVSTREESGQVVLSVRDNGIGIDPLTASRIFELFVQGKRREDRGAGGVGVGLALVKRLVEMHGGNVGVLSAGMGRGSEFVVRLPLVRIAPPGAALLARRESRAVTTHSLRILVVDDNVDAADALKMLLELEGEQVRVAYDGESALATACEFRPGLVLLDVGMPAMDGYELARRLRAAPETRDAVLVAVTGWGQAEDRQRTKNAGFDHHLVKPLDPAMLERLVQSLKTEPAG